MSNPLPEGCIRVKTLYQGAEAIVDLCEWMKLMVVVKTRVAKGYRVKELDEAIRRSRTIREASLLNASKRAGVNTPFVYHVNPVMGWIIMSYIEGRSLRDLKDMEALPALLRSLGTMVGRLHSSGMVHGDLTLSNVILSGSKLFLIDFGLGEYSKELEKRAEDINTMISSLRVFSGFEKLLKVFLEGYGESSGDSAQKVEERLREIERRGRYVERGFRSD